MYEVSKIYCYIMYLEEQRPVPIQYFYIFKYSIRHGNLRSIFFLEMHLMSFKVGFKRSELR